MNQISTRLLGLLTLVALLAAGCATNPGDEVVAFSRNDYLDAKATPMNFAPKSGLYKLYVERGTDDAAKKNAEVIGEAQMQERGRLGFRDKSGSVVAFAQISRKTPEGGVMREDVEFDLPKTEEIDRVFWKYEGP